MRRNYQSDLDEEPRQEPGVWRWIAIALMALLLIAIGTLVAHADDNGTGPCIPTVSDYDSAYRIAGDDFAVIWWCDQPEGLRAYWWTDSVSKANPATVIMLAGRDPDEFRQQLSRRWSTVAQITLAMQVQADHGPRCYHGKQQVSCITWQQVNRRRMCDVSGMIQADGSRLPADSWVACVLERAPAGGWL